jgi:hypothetical protein
MVTACGSRRDGRDHCQPPECRLGLNVPAASRPAGEVAAMTMLQNALAAKHVILSSAGDHAQQVWQLIITRKRADIASTNHTVWVVRSNATRPDAVQSFCGDHDARYVIFVSRERPRSNSTSPSGPPTNTPAREYSSDRKTWSALHTGLGPVTGKIDLGATGFWFDALEQINSGEIDLGSFSKLDGQTLDRFHNHETAYPVRPARLGSDL